MRIERCFTTESDDALVSIETRSITIEICHQDPTKRLCIPDFEIPAHWSNRAGEHLAKRYSRRTRVPAISKRIAEDGVPEWLQRSIPDEEAMAEIAEPLRFGPEISFRQIIHRLVGAWCYWGWTHGYFDTENDARNFYDEMCHLMASQRAMPASPQWQNTGLHWAYGIEGDAPGCVYVDAQNGELHDSPNAYARPQHHHCFIQGVKDELSGPGGIADLWQREMRVFKYGSSSGANLSPLRAASESLSSGMPSAGVVPFMEIGNKAADALGAAPSRLGHRSKLNMIDIDHPDLPTVLQWRLSTHREQMAKAIGFKKLRKLHHQIVQAVRDYAGPDAYDPSINESLADVIQLAVQRSVSEPLIMEYIDTLKACDDGLHGLTHWSSLAESQSSASQTQLGIRISDAFMRAVCDESDWTLKTRTERKAISAMAASSLLDDIAYCNWSTTDGMVQFEDNVQFWHGCKAQGSIRSSSPGGEFLFLDDSACDVASINLARYVEDGRFDIEQFEHTVRLQTIMCDISITMAQFPSADIAYNSYRYRPIGLSFCNVSELLMRMGYAYDSNEGRAIAAAVGAIMTGKGYAVSAEIARELGGFEAFSDCKEGMMQLMWQHHEAAFGRTQHLGNSAVRPSVVDHSALPESELSDAVQRVWDMAMIQGDEFGYSNAQISLIASSPNIVTLMDALSPAVSPVHDVKSVDMTHWYQSVHAALKQLGYRASQIDAIRAYVNGHRSCLGAPHINAESLQERGFTTREIGLIEEALAAGQPLHLAFDPLHIGERFCRETLGMDDAQLHDADFQLLQHIGFDDEAIAACEAYCTGHRTIVGAPYLRQEDYPVFAVSTPHEDNSVSVEAQIYMAAALQPYVSGGIAQVIETPYGSDLKQHRHWMIMGWQMGLKHMDLRRAEQQEMLVAESDLSKQKVAIQQSHSVSSRFSVSQSEVVGLSVVMPKNAMTQAGGYEPLSNHRPGYTQHVTIDDVPICHRTEEYDDGRLGAIQIEASTAAVSEQQLMQHCMGIISTALQHGVTISALQQAISDAAARDEHSTVSGHDSIAQATSVVDYVLQDVAQHYAQQKEVQTEDEPEAKKRDRIILTTGMSLTG